MPLMLWIMIVLWLYLNHIVLIGTTEPINFAKFLRKLYTSSMQRGIRTMLLSLLSRQFRMNDHNLCYHHLAHPVFSDTMFSSTVFRRGSKCVQVYATDCEWARAFPIASRSKVQKTLLLLFVRDGVPPACICDSANRMIEGKFHQKLNDATCHLKWLEPYTPCLNSAEIEIKELQKGTGHKLLHWRAPKCLWDNCWVGSLC